MTSRRLRKLRRESSVSMLLTQATRSWEDRLSILADGAFLSDEQISQLQQANDELWIDAAYWSPELLEEP